jgi:molybdopterin converting factor small subunit
MFDKREMFLENQINLFAVLINDLEGSKMNGKQKRDLVVIKELYKKYIGEYKSLLLENERREMRLC